jgi:hypothetical protein
MSDYPTFDMPPTIGWGVDLDTIDAKKREGEKRQEDLLLAALYSRVFQVAREKIGAHQRAEIGTWIGGHVSELSADTEDGVMQVYQAALEACPNRVAALVATVQAIQESGVKLDSGLARHHNNLFGIKGEGTAGKAFMLTAEYRNGQKTKEVAGFAAYNSLQDSIEDHQDFLERNKRYAKALEAMEHSDFIGATKALQDAGYATDPNYAYNLQRLGMKVQKLVDKMEGTPLVASSPKADGANLPTPAENALLPTKARQISSLKDGMLGSLPQPAPSARRLPEPTA